MKITLNKKRRLLECYQMPPQGIMKSFTEKYFLYFLIVKKKKKKKKS